VLEEREALSPITEKREGVTTLPAKETIKNATSTVVPTGAYCMSVHTQAHSEPGIERPTEGP
jgi:hypothetical protein